MVMQMKRCEQCGVQGKRPRQCARCAAPPFGRGGGEAVYPAVGFGRGYHFVKRLLLFCPSAVIVCAVVNLATMPNFWWWAIVATALTYAWAVGSHSLRPGGNSEAGCWCRWWPPPLWCCCWISRPAGAAGRWILLPAICGVGIAAILVLIALQSHQLGQYVLYQIALCLCAHRAVFFHVSHVFWAASIPAVMALASLVALFLFGDRSIKNEFVRRLHL